jgi:hypothetical protein
MGQMLSKVVGIVKSHKTIGVNGQVIVLHGVARYNLAATALSP